MEQYETYTANWPTAGVDFDPSAERAAFEFTTPKPSWIDRIRAATLAALPSILVVDISHYNGVINWPALRSSGIQGVIMKVSESTTYKDSRFEINWQEARDNDFAVMCYHFFRDKPGADELDWFMNCAVNFLDDVDGHTAMALDVETNNGVTPGVRADRAFDFCSLAKAAGLIDGIYSSPYLVNSLFPASETRWNNLAWQWVAHWTSASTYILPTGWNRDKVKAWQIGISPTHSWVPKISGAGTVDVNRMYFASEAELKGWLGQVEQPGYPYMTRVIVPGVVRASANPMALPLWVAEIDTGLTVFSAVEDDDGVLWYDVGSGWLPAASVRMVE